MRPEVGKQTTSTLTSTATVRDACTCVMSCSRGCARRACVDVLVVDPSELGELLTTLLVQYGFSVHRVGTGEDALTFALDHNPTCVVVEAELPDTSGLDIAELCHTELGTIAVLTYPPGFVAADPDVAARVRALAASFVRPFRSLSLIEAVAAACGRSLHTQPLTSTEGYPVDSLADDFGNELLLTEAVDAVLEGTVDVDLNDDEDFIRADEPDHEPFIIAHDEAALHPPIDDDAATTIPQAARPTSTEAARPLDEVVSQEEHRRTTGAFSPGDLAELWQRTRARRTSSPAVVSAPASEGKLTPRVLADLLDAFHQSQTSGEIWLSNGSGQRLLLLRRGVVVGARSNLAGEDLLTRLLKRGALTRDDVEHVAFLLRTGQHASIVEAIVDNELVDEATLRAVIDDHVRRVAIAAFSWATGTYRITLEGRAAREVVSANVHVGDVVVHAIMLTESDNALRKAAPDDARFAPVGDAVYGLEHLRLTPGEARVVIAMDGTKTIADLLVLTAPTTERVVRGLAAGLLCLHLARFAGRGAASARKISFF
jgi:CheY-like chemotaxis protein